MKECRTCQELKPLELFSANARNKDGKHNWCKACFAKYERERYHAGDRLRKEANKAKTVAANREYIWKVLSENPCVDCGEFDPIVLDFDHQGDKSANVSEMLYLSSRRIQEEIAKCVVRCANCHRRKTARDFGYWKAARL